MWFRRKTDDRANAERALKEAERSLTRARRRGREVSMVANALRDLRERDRFAEEIEEILFRSEG